MEVEYRKPSLLLTTNDIGVAGTVAADGGIEMVLPSGE